MKIGILTFHKSINPGAFLQAYALQMFLTGDGYEALILNYTNRTHRVNELKAILFKKNPIKVLNNFLKYLTLNRMVKSNFKLLDLKDVKELDAVIVGSDIVWDFRNPFFDFDPVYFGALADNKIKLLSYAASCGSAGFEEFPEKIVELIRKNFTAISVRDNNTFSLVVKRAYREAAIVVDPVFLYNFERELGSKGPIDKYILLYALNISPEQMDDIKKFAREKKLKIIAIGYYNAWADVNKIKIDPFEWARYIKYAKYFITSTFHGVLFAIKFNKNFCYLDNPATYIKLSATLDLLDLSRRVCKDYDVSGILSRDINYNDLTLKLQQAIALSKLWLKENL